MALVLHIETATTVCSVALSRDGELLALKEENSGYTHAENLTLFVEEVFDMAKINITEIDVVAVSKGPGSYTGLRIGVSTAKGICYGLNKPLIAIDTLQSLAHKFIRETCPAFEAGLSRTTPPKAEATIPRSLLRNLGSGLAPRFMPVTSQQHAAGSPDLFCPMLDARRMEVYCALYDEKSNPQDEVEAKIIDETSFKDRLENTRIFFFGSGAEKCRVILGMNKNAQFIDGIVPSAVDMISFGEASFKLNKFEDLAYFEPRYLKDFILGPKNV